MTTAVRPPRLSGPAPTAPVPASAAPEVSLRPAASLPLLREAATPPDAVLERKTKVDGTALQVVFGERAVFTLAAEDRTPRLLAIEPGRLAIAHPPGQVVDILGPPPGGRMAAALDGSAEKGASFLRLWNSLDRPVAYRAEALVLRAGHITRLAAPVCVIAPGQIRTLTWPSALAAVWLSRFADPEPGAEAHAGCG